MTQRKFYHRIVTLEFISETPYPADWGIENMVFDAQNGDSSMQQLSEKTKEVNGLGAVKILLSQGSDPGFFKLTANGNDIQ